MSNATAKAMAMAPKQCSPPRPRSMNEVRPAISPSALIHSIEVSKDLFRRVQSNRKLCGSSPLQWSELLCEAATYHNFEMGNEGKRSESQFTFGSAYSEMILKLIAGAGQNFLSEKKRPSLVSKKLMRLWASRECWNEIMLDPIAKYCAIAVAMNGSHVYCTAIFSVYDAFKFPPLIGHTAYIDHSQRMRYNPIPWTMFGADGEYSFHRRRREEHELQRPYPVEPMFCCDLFTALKSFVCRFFPDNKIEKNEGPVYDSRPQVEEIP